MVTFAYKSIAYITFVDSLFAHKIYCVQLDCLHAFLHTNTNFRNGVTFAYIYYCLQVLLPTSIIAYSSIAYVHFCAQIKILETELLLPILLLPTARLPTCITCP